MAAIEPRSIDELIALSQQNYIDEGGDPLRVREGGDFYWLMRGVAKTQAIISMESFIAAENAFLDSCFDEELVDRHINPYGIYRSSGTVASGGIVARASSTATPKTLPLGAVFTIGTKTYVTTAAVALSAPWKVIPIVCTTIGTEGNALAGLSATLVAGAAFSDYDFFVGGQGLNGFGNPYGDINGGLPEETLEDYKQRYYDNFNNSGYALTRIIHAAAIATDPSIVSADVRRYYPAAGYVTVYIDNGGTIVPDALLELVKAEVYKKASAGEVVLVLGADRTVVDLDIVVTTDGTVAPTTAKTEILAALTAYLLALRSAQGLFELKMDDVIANFGYTDKATYQELVDNVLVPFQDKPGLPGTLIRPGTITLRIISGEG